MITKGLTNDYEKMDRDQLVAIIEQQRLELIRKEAICEGYKKHLEQVIEYQSVEKYRLVVQKNREAGGTAPQDSDGNTYCGKPVANY